MAFKGFLLVAGACRLVVILDFLGLPGFRFGSLGPPRVPSTEALKLLIVAHDNFVNSRGVFFFEGGEGGLHVLTSMDPKCGVQAAVCPKEEQEQEECLLLMMYILHHLKDPKLWKLWYIPYYG